MKDRRGSGSWPPPRFWWAAAMLTLLWLSAPQGTDANKHRHKIRHGMMSSMKAGGKQSRVKINVLPTPISATSSSKSLPFVPDFTVCKSGCKFRTVQAAIDAVPWNLAADKGKIIYVKAGVYKEYVFISIVKPYITIIGDPSRTIITGNRSAHDIVTKTNMAALKSSMEAGERPTTLGTIGSPTFVVEAPGFIAVGLTFINTVGKNGGQAPALRATNTRIAFYNCKFQAYQDTLYAQRGLQFYKNCVVEGVVDMVAGQAKARFEDCTLKLLGEWGGAFSAQKRKFLEEDNGYAFIGGKLTGTGKAFLGRAWGKYSTIFFGRVQMDDVVLPDGWQDWGDPSRQKLVSFYEYECTGPGAVATKRVKWSQVLPRNSPKANLFLSKEFILASTWLETPKWLSKWTNKWPIG